MNIMIDIKILLLKYKRMGRKLNRIHQIGFHITTKPDIIVKLCTVKEYYVMNKFHLLSQC